MQQTKIISIILFGLILIIGCENKKEITEQNLLGVWKERGAFNETTNEVKGILISKMDSGLYEEEITIRKSESNFSVFSNGCFIRLRTNEKKEQSLSYLCISGEFEHTINMTSRKLTIGNKIFEKYNY